MRSDPEDKVEEKSPPPPPGVAEGFVKKVYDGVCAGMLAHNPDMKVTLDSDTAVTIELRGRGMFRVFLDQTDMVLMSPKDGQVFRYRYDRPLKSFVGLRDGHFLVELLTRDLLHMCKGVPTF